jgi:hypothetical protein
MKLFDVDWTAVLHDSARWHTLPLPSRVMLLEELKMSGYSPAAAFGDYLDTFFHAGLAQLDPSGRRVSMPEERRSLVKVLRALYRHPLFDAPSKPALEAYLAEHFTNDEISRLSGVTGRHGAFASRASLASLAGFEGWTGDLLAAKSDAEVARWAEVRGMSATLTGHAVVDEMRAVQALATQLLDHPDGLPLRELVLRSANNETPALGHTLHAGLQMLVLFAGMRREDMEPMIGLWPPAARALVRPVITAPAAVDPDEQFTAALRLEDMVVILSAAVSEPLRLRANDFAVFARARKGFLPRLVPSPPWIPPSIVPPPDSRIDAAVRELQLRGFARIPNRRGPPELHATAEGNRWLALAPHDQLHALLTPLRNSPDTMETGGYDDGTVAKFFPANVPYRYSGAQLELRKPLTDAFLSTRGAWVTIDGFLNYAATSANPYLAEGQHTGRRGQYETLHVGGADPRQYYGNIWRGILAHFLFGRLLPFGGVSIGHAGGLLCFALTDAGRYLLGAAGEFEYGAPDASVAIVQPNFDVVFVAPSPGTEVALARFAERTGPAPGIAFRITRASVLGAAEAGAVADDVLAVLRNASPKPVPSNVEREIRGWMSRIRHAALRTTWLVDCPDGETAERVVESLGALARRLTPTVIEVAAGKATDRSALVKRLRASGVFLNSPARQHDADE